MTRLTKKVYRNIAMTLLGVTRVISRAEVPTTPKWTVFIDNVRISSDMAHTQIYSRLDDDTAAEFIKKEEMLEKRMGRESFYSKDEIEELKDKIDQIQV